MEKTRTTIAVWILTCGLVLCWSVLCSGDFYVIPVKSSSECSGDAMIGDVREGKTFSNSRDIGLTGTLQVPSCSDALVPKTGHTECYKSTDPWETCTCGTTNCPLGQDGDLERGVTWPNPRFSDNGNGTVTDNLTGLIWMKNANCDSDKNWGDALNYCNAMTAGYCGLLDGSSAGDWRLPNRFELESLLDLKYYNPALPNTAGTGQWSDGDLFTNVHWDWYWSSSSYAYSADGAWGMFFHNGDVMFEYKVNANYVWCVRDRE